LIASLAASCGSRKLLRRPAKPDRLRCERTSPTAGPGHPWPDIGRPALVGRPALDPSGGGHLDPAVGPRAHRAELMEPLEDVAAAGPVLQRVPDLLEGGIQ